MLDCWHADPHQRPLFTDLTKSFRALADYNDDSAGYINITPAAPAEPGYVEFIKNSSAMTSTPPLLKKNAAPQNQYEEPRPAMLHGSQPNPYHEPQTTTAQKPGLPFVQPRNASENPQPSSQSTYEEPRPVYDDAVPSQYEEPVKSVYDNPAPSHLPSNTASPQYEVPTSRPSRSASSSSLTLNPNKKGSFKLSEGREKTLEVPPQPAPRLSLGGKYAKDDGQRSSFSRAEFGPNGRHSPIIHAKLSHALTNPVLDEERQNISHMFEQPRK
jgi:hypothetical protein